MYHIEEIKNQNLERVVKVTIPTADIEEKFQEKLTTAIDTTSIRGFRKGKVPKNIIEQQFGNSIYADMVIETIENYANQITKADHLVTQPKLEILNAQRHQDVIFTLEYEIFPILERTDLSKVTIEQPKFVLTDLDITNEIENLLHNATTYEVIDSQAALDNAVKLDVKGMVSDGSIFPAKDIKQAILRLNDFSFFSEAFNQAITGKKAGDTVEININYDQDDNNKTIAGKNVCYKVTIHSVHSVIKPELNDEFAKTIGYSNVIDLKQDLLNKKQEYCDDQVYIITSMRLFDKLENLLNFDIPKSILDQEIKNISQEIEKLKDEELKNKNPEDIKNYAEKFASRRIRIGMMLNHYAKLNNISVIADDIKKEVLKKVKMFPHHMQKEMLQWYYKDPKHLNSLSGSALEHKIVSHIIQHDIEIKHIDCTVDELLKIVEQETEKRMY